MTAAGLALMVAAAVATGLHDPAKACVRQYERAYYEANAFGRLLGVQDWNQRNRINMQRRADTRFAVEEFHRCMERAESK